jgi:hypothetical protein
MPYLGNNPTANFATVTKDTFSGNGSTTAFTLSKTATTNGVAVYVENVRQIPTTAYAISGTTLTFTGAPVSGTNNIYVMHHNTPVSTATHPAAQALTATSGTFTGDVSIDGGSFVFNESSADKDFRVESNDNANMLFVDGGNNKVGIGTGSPNDYYAKDLVVNSADEGGITILNSSTHAGGLFFADGTSANAYRSYIQYDHNTDEMVIATAATHAMKIDANGHVTMPKQPAFSVTANQQNDLSINASNVIQFANEIFDLNADFNTSNYTFTAPVTGKYMLNVNLRMDNVDRDHSYMYMILATSNREYEWLVDVSVGYSSDPDYLPFTINVLADMDASDTAQVKMHIPNAGAAQSDVVGSNKTTFSGFLAC